MVQLCSCGGDSADPWVLGDTATFAGVQSDHGRGQEQHRRDLWNYKYDFGAKATMDEQRMELARRERYENKRAMMSALADLDGR